jgi:thiol-disulfide isomerase/thioredoxin
LSWLSLLVLPYTIFSVYYQSQIVKQWCILCLAVQLLLVLGAVHSLVFYQLQPLSVIPLPFFALFFLPALAWFAIKPLLLKLQKAKTEKREHLRLKFNTEIFDTLLKKQKQITEPADGLGILLGNKNAAHELIKVCNPYCGPCSKAHPEIEKLLEQNENLKARIIFTATNDDNDRAAIPVKHLLAVASSKNEAAKKQALDDWYLANKKDYDVFAAKYPINGELQQQDEKVDSMSKWCKTIGIQFTPTIFINGYQLPDAYSIVDLKYFLLE